MLRDAELCIRVAFSFGRFSLTKPKQNRRRTQPERDQTGTEVKQCSLFHLNGYGLNGYGLVTFYLLSVTFLCPCLYLDQ